MTYIHALHSHAVSASRHLNPIGYNVFHYSLIHENRTPSRREPELDLLICQSLIHWVD